MKIPYLVVASCLLLSSVAFANDDNTTSVSSTTPADGYWKTSFSLGIDFIRFDSQFASTEELGDSTAAIHLAGAYHFTRHFSAAAGIGIARLDDSNEFSQVVVDEDGFVRVVSSETNMTTLFAEAWFRSVPREGGSFFYGAGIGAAAVTKAEREIDNCPTCESLDLDIDGGSYLLATLGINVGKTSKVGVTGRYYTSGDLQNSVLLWWQSR